MLKQTTQLFIKALIIGILVNITLQQVPADPVSSDNDVFRQHQGQQPLKPLSVNTPVNDPAQSAK